MIVSCVDSLLILQTAAAETEVALVEDVCRANRIKAERYGDGSRPDYYAALWIVGGVDLTACLNRGTDGCQISNGASMLVSHFYGAKKKIFAPCMAILIALKTLCRNGQTDKSIAWKTINNVIVSDDYRLISTNRPLLGVDGQVKQVIYSQMLACT
jgi:hypothetical protein